MQQFFQIFNSLPLLSLYILTLFAVWLGYELAYQIGSRIKQEKVPEAPITLSVSATMGLLAFLLAFTFSFNVSRFQERVHLLVDETNAIETTYLRAGYLPDSYRNTLRKLLRDYAQVRSSFGSSVESVQKMVVRSEQIQDQLWQQAEEVAKINPNSVVTGLFIQSLNELIDLHTKRVVAGLQIRMPAVIWLTLYLVTFLSFGIMGYHAGLDGNRSFFVHFALIFAFSTVVMLIVDLDRPFEGFLKVSQQPLVDLFHKLK